MGADIHAYVEFADKPEDGRAPYWKNLTRNSGSRNYVLFGVLAGVRCKDQLFPTKLHVSRLLAFGRARGVPGMGR